MEDLEQKDITADAITPSQSADADELTDDDLEDVAGGIVWTPQDDSKWERPS